MDKSKIVKFFMERGAHVDKTVLDIIYNNDELFERLKSLDRKDLPHFITADFIAKLQERAMPLSEKELKLSSKDYLQYYIKRYDAIKQILINKPDLSNLVSVNKMSARMQKFSLIGIVTSVDYDTLTIEDTTGTARLSIDNGLSRTLTEDEVIGVVCEKTGNTHKAVKLIFPDTPVKKDVAKTKNDHLCFFISDIHMDSEKFNLEFYQKFLNWVNEQIPMTIFVLGNVSQEPSDIEKFIKDVSKHSIIFIGHDNLPEGTKGHRDPLVYETEGIKIFASEGNFLTPYINRWSMQHDEAVINLLKKRHLNPTDILNEDSFFLKTLPDILAFGNIGKPSATNYKGTTIIFSGNFTSEPVYRMINLGTRETFKIDFS
ncbi:MAG: hypothetical protein HYW24_01875 [Candidatus Aenigmarchaeota archaeon]|nr:hypothetical protein [Candidatus Aenigmarchaeota archaeon]